MRTSLLLFLLCLIGWQANAQKFVQLEKTTNLKTKRFYIGEEMTYRINDDKYWYNDVIKDVLVEDGIILFHNRAVKVGDISAIKTFYNAGWSKGLSWKLYIFAGSYTLLNFASLPLGWSLSALTWQVPLVAITAGFIVRMLFKSKKYKIGKKRRLRLMNLNFKPILSP